MKLCMSFVRDLINAPVLEIQDTNDRWDDFDLEGWQSAAPNMKVRKGNLVIGNAEELTAAGISKDVPAICAGPAPDITLERFMAVDMDTAELTQRLDNIFHSFELFEHRINDSARGMQDRHRMIEQFRQLLDGQYVSPRTLETTLKVMNWSPAGPYLCVCILSDDVTGNQEIAPYYSRMISGEIHGACVFEQDDLIVCIVDLSWFDGTTNGFMQRNVAFFRDNIFRAGLSNEFRDIRQLAAYWRQAVSALKVGTAASSSIWYHRFADRALDYLMQQSVLELDAEHVSAPQLIALRDHDAKNGTDYFNTLKIYLRNNMNVVQTAKEMYIHRGTMNYRLKRIEELTDLELDDPDIRLYLALSYKLLEKYEMSE